jgi:hypothetical protein
VRREAHSRRVVRAIGVFLQRQFWQASAVRSLLWSPWEFVLGITAPTSQQINDFNAVLAKNNLQELKVPSTSLTNASCSFIPEQGRKVNK